MIELPLTSPAAPLHWSRYKIRLQKGDIAKHADFIRRLLETSYREFGGGEP